MYADAFLVGTAMNADMVSGKDARAQALVPLHFNAITAENAMKAEELHPEPGTWDFADADAFVEFGQRHGLFMVGHTLVWHNQTPAWFFEDADGSAADTATMRERMRQYIHTVAGRYAGRVHAWDVVNEQIGEDGQYRDTLWTRAYGGDGDPAARRVPLRRRGPTPSSTTTTSTPGARKARRHRAHGQDAAGARHPHRRRRHPGHWGLNYPSTAHMRPPSTPTPRSGSGDDHRLEVDVLPLTRKARSSARA